MKASTIIIQRPERVPKARRTFLAVLTMLAWLVWISLWLPLVTLVLWLLGLHQGYVELMVRMHGHGWRELLVLVDLVLVCMGTATLWSLYNYLYFRRRDRRRRNHPVELLAIARVLGVQERTARCLREASSTVLAFAEDGTVSHLDSLPAAALWQREGRAAFRISPP